MKKYIATAAAALCMASSVAHAAFADLTTFVGTPGVTTTANQAILKDPTLSVYDGETLTGTVTGLTSFDWHYEASIASAGYATVATSFGSAILLDESSVTGADSGPQTYTFSTPYTGFIKFLQYAYAGGEAGATLTISNLAVASVVSPVPEPESYAMLLAGLGVMGAIARRKKSVKRLSQRQATA